MELPAMCTLVPDASAPTRLSAPSDFPGYKTRCRFFGSVFYLVLPFVGNVVVADIAIPEWETSGEMVQFVLISGKHDSKFLYTDWLVAYSGEKPHSPRSVSGL